MQVERTEFHDQDGYWRTYWDDDVFYGHVLGCKGLERRAVVLCLNEDGSRDRSRERLYVGMSRATDMLVVVGGPGVGARGRRRRGREAARDLSQATRETQGRRSRYLWRSAVSTASAAAIKSKQSSCPREGDGISTT